jgi:hypothetical protein
MQKLMHLPIDAFQEVVEKNKIINKLIVIAPSLSPTQLNNLPLPSLKKLMDDKKVRKKFVNYNNRKHTWHYKLKKALVKFFTRKKVNQTPEPSL